MKDLLGKHRRTVAIATSIALHAAIIAYLLMPASGALSALDLRQEGQSDKAGLNVELIEPVSPGPKLSHPAPSPMQSFMDMTEPPNDQGWKVAAPKPAANLSDIFGKEVFAQSPKAAETTKQSASDNHISLNDREKTSVNDLWKAISPCWRRLADKSTLGVTLNVSFSPLGNLSKPPVILRDAGSRLTDQQLRSESLAINALAQCGPYLMAFGQSDVKVQFPAGG